MQIEKILEQEFKVLDKGFIRVIDYMGGDHSVTQAARVSYGKGTKSVRDDEKLINYLLKHDHGTPFEMTCIKFHVKCPIFVARQWVRHRIGSSFNEYSARYSEIKDEFYIPELHRLTKQHKSKKQCSSEEPLKKEDAQAFVDSSVYLSTLSKITYNQYNQEKIELAREINRINIPLSNYTEFYWCVNLRSLMHFIKLRNNEHAQYEIREYSKILQEILKIWCPLTYGAFVEYVLEAVIFSRKEKIELDKLLSTLVKSS